MFKIGNINPGPIVAKKPHEIVAMRSSFSRWPLKQAPSARDSGALANAPGVCQDMDSWSYPCLGPS